MLYKLGWYAFAVVVLIFVTSPWWGRYVEEAQEDPGESGAKPRSPLLIIGAVLFAPTVLLFSGYVTFREMSGGTVGKAESCLAGFFLGLLSPFTAMLFYSFEFARMLKHIDYVALDERETDGR